MIDKNKLQRSLEFRKAMQMFAATLVDDEAAMIAIPSIYPVWAVGTAYKTKDVFSYGVNSVGDIQLYQVLQDHTATEEHTPDTAVSLYKAIGVSPSGIPMWVQPLGVTDAYNKGDVVMHNDKQWKSLYDANTWEPGVFGWEEITDDGGDTPSTDDDIPDFVQPDASHYYMKGDKVRFEGKVYESLIDNNTYSPTEYPAGWKEIES